MTDVPDTGTAPAGGDGTGGSAGALLRQAREAAGVHIGALSVALKVPVRKLEALEGDRFDQLPDAVFARALASSICRHLKVDPAPILARLPEQAQPQLQLDCATSDRTNLASSGPIWNMPWLTRLPRPVLLLALALIVAAGSLLFLPDHWIDLQGASEEPAASPSPAASATVQVPVTLPAAAPTPPDSAAAGTAPAPAMAPAAQAPASEPVAAAAPAPAAQAASGPAASGGGPPLGLRARGTSWVEVTDAAGTVQLRRLLQAGEAVSVSGTLPLAVVVGRADAIDVQVRGQVLNLAPLARDNVARFQVQ
jgi:cytoskeleton protein RodZ